MNSTAAAQRRALPKAGICFLAIALLAIALAGGTLFATQAAPEAQQTQAITGLAVPGFARSRVIFTPTGESIIGTEKTSVVAWDRASGRELPQFTLAGGDQPWFYDLQISPDGTMLAIGGSEAIVLDRASGKQIRSIRPLPNSRGDEPVYQVAFSPDSAKLAIQSGSVAIYDIASGTYEQNIPAQQRSLVTLVGMAFSPDGRYIAVGQENGQTALWDLHSRQIVRTFEGGGTSVGDLAFSPDGRSLATADDNGTASIWDIASGRLARRITVGSDWDTLLGRRPHAEPHSWSSAIAFSHDGGRLAVGGNDATAGVWDVRSGVQIYRLTGHTGMVSSIAFSPNDRSLVTRSADGSVRVWSVAAP
ncbi:WD40 repeat domain-containing protein [Chloroflexia bacterium SDU3-3]|nr:WD40 repeat domain-containing protein [Chloroflexia bacterium SDU3-3]